MKLPFLSGRPKKPMYDTEPMIAVDIGTEVLKTLLFRCDTVGVHILDSSRIFQQQHAMRSGVIRSLETVIENCRLGLNDVTKSLEPEQMPKKIVMGIAGELIHGVSVEVNYDREENAAMEVDEKEQGNILSQVKENIHESGRMELAN